MNQLKTNILLYNCDIAVTDKIKSALPKHGDYRVVCFTGEEVSLDCYEKIDMDIAIMSIDVDDSLAANEISILRHLWPNIKLAFVQADDIHNKPEDIYKLGFEYIINDLHDAVQLEGLLQKISDKVALRDENIRLNALLPIYELGEKFINATSDDDIFEAIISIVHVTLEVPRITIMMFDDEAQELRIAASKGMDETLREKISVKPGESIAGWVFSKGEPVILNKDTQTQSPFADLLRNSDINASISFPILSFEKVVGVLNISQNEKQVEYSKYELDLLKVICRQAGIALQNIESQRTLQKSSRLKALFQQYVSPEVAEILLEEQKNLIEVGTVETLSVLFADIRNFTLLVQKIPPNELRNFLNSFFDLFADVVYKAKGTLDKFMGDAALVIFGAPLRIDTPCDTAIETAVEIMRKFEELRETWVRKDECFKDVGLGIGISRGEMFLGNVGSDRRFDYTVIGTDVNIAQRLASDANSGQILITSNVQSEINGKFKLVLEPDRKLRSVERSIKLYSVQC